MPRAKVILILSALLPLVAADFSGVRAMSHVRRAVGFGPRPSGSAAIGKLQDYIRDQLKSCRCEVSEDRFAAQTPEGAVPMVNIIARFTGQSRQAIVVTGHYDTKRMDGFTGANDGGSSTGVLLELATALAGRSLKQDVVLVWLDGEEAVRQWSESDSLYGSRHLAARWAAGGTLDRIRALINVDMIGDRDLGILPEGNSTPWLRAKVWALAAEMGFSRHFLASGFAIEDDHLPFAERGVAVLDLIDFDYGPNNSWWHTREDSIDKLSAASLEVVGRLLVALTLNGV